MIVGVKTGKTKGQTRETKAAEQSTAALQKKAKVEVRDRT
jgi:hypothetical protein